MKSLSLSILLGVALLVSSCRHFDYNPIDPHTSTVAGNYRSTIFIAPSPWDGADSCHLRGDYVALTLKEDGTMSGTVERSYMENGTRQVNTTPFSGTYTVRNDSLFWHTPGWSLGGIRGWKRTGNDFEAKGIGWAPEYIYLKRQ